MATTIEELVKTAKSQIVEIEVSEAKKQDRDAVVFIDVREPPEWEAGTVPGAICIPRGVLEWRCSSEKKLEDKATPVVVYCKSGGRSALAAQTLQQLGFENVMSMAGGFDAWDSGDA